MAGLDYWAVGDVTKRQLNLENTTRPRWAQYGVWSQLHIS